MSRSPKDDDAKFNETLKRMFESPPTPHKPKPVAKPRKAKPAKRA